jgi:hypothetical protein
MPDVCCDAGEWRVGADAMIDKFEFIFTLASLLIIFFLGWLLGYLTTRDTGEL